MEIKNEALRSLYESLVADVWSIRIDALFKKCDDELEKEKEELMKDLDDAKKQLNYFTQSRDDWRGRAKHAEKENEDLKAKMDNDLVFFRIRQLEETNARLIKEKEDLQQPLEKEINELKKQNYTLGEKCQDETRIRKNWKQMCHEQNERIWDLMKKKQELHQQLDTECKKKQDLQEQLDNIGKTYCETAMRVGKLVREKETLQNQLDSSNAALERLRERYEEEIVCRRKWAKLAGYRDKRIEELQLQIDTLTRKDAVFVDLDSAKLTGMEGLWGMIREVNSAPIEALYNSGAFNNKLCVGTIVNMYPDVRDFVKEYKTWKNGKEETDEEQKRLAYMRDYLHRFCVGKVCYGCPLNTDEFKCYGHSGFDSISDEDVKRYYEKARGCGLAQALKIAINSVYGLTAANFNNEF